MDTDTIHTGDAFDVLPTLPADSVHAAVTDPPYGLAFMGRDWDDFEPREYQEWCEEWAREVKRVLNPGGHLLAFSGNRTHHRLFSGVEDAGFEIRDTVTWHYGSGFPKALDVSKAIDKRGGRTVKGIGPVIKTAREDKGLSTRDVAEHFADDGQEPTGCVWNWENGASNPTVENFNKLIDVLDLALEPIEPGDREVVGTSDQTAMTGDVYDSPINGGFEITEPATDAAERWDGFKTALKPATEYVVVARKPLSEGTVAENVQTHGTGALNIDGTRIGYKSEADLEETNAKNPGRDDKADPPNAMNPGMPQQTVNTKGRYPSNVVFDATEAERLDRKVGELSGGARTPQSGTGRNTSDAPTRNDPDERIQLESGGPSRYFYTSKASKAERTEDGSIENDHPTVKPLDLAEWLVKLVTAEGQIVLDPFAGSGTIPKAAKQIRRQFIGIERQAKYADVARVRCGLTPADPSTVREDGQGGIDDWT